MGDEQQRAGVGGQRLGQALAHVDIQVVRRLIQKHQVRAFKGQLGKAQAGQLAAGEGRAVLKDFLAPVAEACQMAADFQLGEAGVLVPDGVDDAARPAGLLLGEDAGFGPAAQTHHAARRAALAVQHLQKRRFTRAVGAGNDELVSAVDNVIQCIDEGALADVYAQVFHDDQLVIRLNVVLKAEV